MSDSYYVRSQGKVHGPFSFEDLKAKAGRGHLKKTHQVSTDRKTWQAARRVEGLFPPPPKLPQQRNEQQEFSKPAEPELVEVTLIEDEPLEVVLPDEELEWHYCLQGDEKTQGPVSESKLRRLFQSGRLPSDTLVWNETLSDWVEAGRIPALQGGPANTPAVTEIPLMEPTAVPAGGELPVPPMASASLILGILGIIIPVIPSVLAIVFGHLALGQIKANRRVFQGENTAKAGLILGYAVLAVLLLIGSIWLIWKLVKG